MGVGIAGAILIDLTIIRAVLLPATMKLLGDWRWYLPTGSNDSRARPSSQPHRPDRQPDTGDAPPPDRHRGQQDDTPRLPGAECKPDTRAKQGPRAFALPRFVSRSPPRTVAGPASLDRRS
jgi:hypothetical protein